MPLTAVCSCASSSDGGSTLLSCAPSHDWWGGLARPPSIFSHRTVLSCTGTPPACMAAAPASLSESIRNPCISLGSCDGMAGRPSPAAYANVRPKRS